jgi:predicted transcriptional regulator
MALMKAKRRNTMEITIGILEEASEGGATKTALVYRTGINFMLAKRYISFLLERNLLEEVTNESPPQHFYRTTEKGLQMLSGFYKIRNMLEIEVEALEKEEVLT